MNLVQVTILGLIVVVIGVVVIMVMLEREAKRKRRMRSVILGDAHGFKGDKNADNPDKRRADMAQKLKQNKIEEQGGAKTKTTIADSLGQAGLNISVKQFWVYSFVSMLVFTLVAVLLGKSPFIILMVAVISLLGVPRLVLRHKSAKRQKEFLEEFPDALEAVVRLLKAGMPVAEAVAMISKEFEGPVGEEMLRIYDKQKIGIPLHEAAQESTRRMPLTEMAMFATGLAIQAQTGSSLSEVLTNLSGVIRARFRLKRKVKALASEAVASASIIGALPLIVASGMWFVNREYIDILFTTSQGKFWLGIAIGMMMFGVFVMRQMINFKV